jgi:hypothetical protein
LPYALPEHRLTVREELRQLVHSRAGERCEYCHFPGDVSFLPFQIDHIIAEKHLGPTTESNLAWACYYCNSYQGPNISGWDPDTEEVIRLFHPRRDTWHEHFAWLGPLLTGLTKIGRATIQVLEINHPDAIAVRRRLIEIGGRLDGIHE